MNPYFKNNAYEILDDGNMNYHPKYPLTQPLGSELQNIHYKDWLATFPERNDSILGENSSLRDGIITSTNIIAYLLSVPFPAAGAAAGILGALLGFLWPTNTQAVWEAFMEAVEALIDQKISDFAREQAIARLEGINKAIELYQNALSNLEKNPNNAVLREHVREQFIATNTYIVGSMPLFRVKGYEVPMLTMFTEAANLHLLILRDAAKFGASWDMDVSTIESYQQYLEKETVNYTDYCVGTYNVGLEEAKTLFADLCDLNTYPWTRYNQGWREEEKPNCSLQQINRYEQQLNEQINSYRAAFRYSPGEYQKLENWNLYNAFRRNMTIMVLDLVSLWPTYNPKQYVLPVKAELTREIYTDIRGTTYQSDESQNTLPVIEGRMIPPPRLFQWLRSFTFHLQNVHSDWTAGQIATGLQQTVQTTLGPSQVLPLTGVQGTSTTSFIPYIDGITRIDTQQWFEPRRFKFWSGGYIEKNFGSIEEKSPFWAEGPKWRVYEPSARANEILEHRLSWMTYEPVRSNAPFVYPQYKQLGALALGWTHQSVDPENRVVSDKITQIPAVKAYWNRGAFSVVKGSGSTGGDLVQLSPSGEVSIMVKPSRSGIGQFRVRIRYAATANGRLNIKKYVGSIHASQSYDYKQTTTSNLTFSAFQYLDVYNFNLAETQFEVWLTNESGGPIFIDKIEFIPTTPTPEPEPQNPPVPEGRYQMVTALNNSSIVDLNLSQRYVQIYGNGNAENQKWRFVYDASKDAYQIINVAAGQELVLSWFQYPEEPDAVIGEPNNKLNRQYWIFEDAGNGYTYVRNMADLNRVLDVPNGNTGNGTPIYASYFSGGTNQKFKLNKL
ncbi:insecticidal delta-endotoxin Cry8Ea1 family protein [Bacillus paralicheniformis]|uniref:insecticidal delta-endotoxin Cry8Ea1 family protein n=2 Tax=Bacillus TaxID=1386 RepID=UPI0002E5FC64